MFSIEQVSSCFRHVELMTEPPVKVVFRVFGVFARSYEPSDARRILGSAIGIVLNFVCRSVSDHS